MTFYQFLYGSAIALNLALGVMVVLANPGRPLNRRYLLFSLVIGTWQICGWRILHAEDPATADLFIRLASSVVALVPLLCWMLGLAIKYPSDPPGRLALRIWPFLAVTFLVAAIPQTPGFIRSVVLDASLPELRPIAEPEYGPEFAIYGLGILGIVLVLIGKWVWDLRSARGVERAELGFVVLGATAGVFLGFALGILVPLVTGSSRYIPIVHSVSVLALGMIVAYGISTRRVLDIGDFIRRMLGHLLAMAYLAGIFAAAWQTVAWGLRAVAPAADPVWAYAVASIVTAFAMAPIFGWTHRLTGRVFRRGSGPGLRATVQDIQQEMQTVTTTEHLLEMVGGILRRASRAQHVEIHAAADDGYVRAHPPGDGRPSFLAQDPLVRILARRSEPLAVHDLQRRPSAGLAEAGRRMRELDADVAVGIRSHGNLQGFLLLGPRASGRIYDGADQDALQILGNHLAVSLENARLYTRVQEQTRYLDVLLEHLASGVVASDAHGVITLVNHEARRLTGHDREALVGAPIRALAPPLGAFLEETLRRGRAVRDRDAVLSMDAGSVPIRASTSLFRDREGEVLGALLVFQDLTAIRSLEEQVRRTERLAGVGTLAAGMAHEIKNPLVAIKTFAELLPDRYDDPDFRETCSALLGGEAARIDGLVNQLLHFARPRAARLEPLSLHASVQDSLRLVKQSAAQREVTIETRLDAERDRIQGDDDLLTQAFVNFFLNAIEAMDRGGTLTVRTDAVRRWTRADGPDGEFRRQDSVALTIRDTGCGIPPENLPRLFDPFFTTKAHGTGLGLPVAHGILRDHGCAIDVERNRESGASFVLVFPLLAGEDDAP